MIDAPKRMISHLLISEKRRQADKYVKQNFSVNENLFFEITPSATKYTIADVKQVLADIKVFNSQKRLYYFPDFDNSSVDAQNAMLKMLEEPPANVHFVLTAQSTSRLLPTIVSRTKVVNVGPRSIPTLDSGTAHALEQFLEKKSLKGLDFKAFTVKDGKEAREICDQIVVFFRKLMSKDKSAPVVMKEGLRLRALMENNNLTPQMTIDHILIFISGIYKMKL